MKTSLHWLRNYIDINWNARELAEMLTLAGLEVESIEEAAQLPETVVVGRILTRGKHPNADKLSVCQVDTGAEKPLQIVCGAPNCAVGSRIPVALVGTRLADDFKIKKSKLRGVASEGMMCSAAELGLGSDQDGLLQLSPELTPGLPVAQCLGSDTIIDWEVTPNRPDWLSHLGIAREIAALAGHPDCLRTPQPILRPLPGSDLREFVSLQVDAPDLCPRYTARLLRQVKIKPSPEWMQSALTAVGIRPINNVVDITNYVMMECGQPLHAFDCDRVRDGRLIVRRADEGETIVTLDQRSHRLTSRQLLIADPRGGIALAGVMGGANSEIGRETTSVLLESACFAPASIRATARQLGMHSESSHRFERGVDIEAVELASRRAAALIQELADAELVDGCLDFYPEPYQPEMVPCRIDRVNQLLGVELSIDRIVDYFERLRLTIVRRETDILSVSIPSFRRDLSREADLIEEAARLYGLQNIPARSAAAVVGGSRHQDAYVPIERARDGLLALGFQETMTYSTISADDALAAIGGSSEQLIELDNPISAESACMRPSLLPGLLRTVAHNVAHGNHDLAIFEIGRIIVNHPDFPEERYQAGLALGGRPHPERYGDERGREFDFFDLKGRLEGWFACRNLPEPDCRPARHPALVDGQTAEMTIDGQTVATLGRVRPELTRGMRLQHPLFVALVELDRAAAVAQTDKKARLLPQFPATTRDISMIVPDSLSHRDIVKAIRECRCPWLEDIQLFDLYQDRENLGPNRRSLAYSLTYRDSARTLTDDEATQAHEQIKEHLAARLKLEFR